MKLTYKKFSYSGIFVVLCILSIFVCIFLIFMNIQVNETQSMLDRGWYTENAVKLELVQPDDNMKLKTDSLSESPTDSFLLYQINLDQENDLRAVYISGSPQTPPVTDGRFFSEEDAGSDKKTAVVGKNYLDILYRKDGRYYIEIDKVSFEVIGIIGLKNQDSRLDRMRLINFASGTELYARSRSFILDGPSKQAVASAYSKINPAFGNQLTPLEQKDPSREEHFNKPDVSIFDLKSLEQTGVNLIIYAIVLITFILCTVSTTMFWLQGRRQEIGVCRLLGLSKSEIGIKITARYLYLVAAGIVLGLLMVLLFGLCGLIAEFSVWDVVLSVLITFAVACIIMNILLIKQSFSTIPDQLR